ncbi:MAG TPA: phosphoribosylformylglycinamidine synthase subunit PurQ [Actinomycetota bacterium]|nr:phosphoribosylformylglycinamidine synthase subunit PurQ [Actinomycetota bacterium]
MKPTVNVLYFPGTNCQVETMRAFRHVGAEPRLVFIEAVLDGDARLDDADVLCIPGGFSYGDHLGAGTIAGLLLRTRLRDQLARCQTKPMLCICNGFQIAVRAGLFGEGVTLVDNDIGTFHNRPDQVHVVEGDPGVWLNGLAGQTLTFPCAHGEGRFVFERHEGWRPALRYPRQANPDGSTDDVAGITSPDGLVLGLMNHPERHPGGDGNLALFENGVRAVAA